MTYECASCGRKIRKPATKPCDCGGKLWESPASKAARLEAAAAAREQEE